MKLHKLTISVCLLFACSVGISSAGIIDQDFVTTDDPNHNSGVGLAVTSLAQTFTVGTSGVLESIEFNVLKFDGTIGDLTFDVRSLDAGKPDSFMSNALFTSTVSNSDVGTFGDKPYAWSTISVDLISANIEAAIGDMFAFVLTSIKGEVFGFQTDYLNGYSRGQRYFQDGDGNIFETISNADLTFKTTMSVSVPEPSSITLLAFGLLSLGILRHKIKILP